MRRWRTTNRGTAGTLWWYSASLEVLTPPVHAVSTGHGDADEFGRRLQTMLGLIIDPLSAVCGVRPARFWAIASDALGNRLLAEGRTDLAGAIASAAGMIEPRYVQVQAGSGRWAYLRRASCCMIFRLPGQELCVSCPRQTPAQRQDRLEQYARQGQ